MDPVANWLIDTADPDRDQSEVAGTELPDPTDALSAAARLIGRVQLLDHANQAENHQRLEKGSLPRPSFKILSEASDLVSLARDHVDTLGPDLSHALEAASAAAQAAHTLEPVSTASRKMLREAVDAMSADRPAPRRWLVWSFEALARRTVTAGRPDIWQEEVGYLISRCTAGGGGCPPDLAQAVAAFASMVVASDPRWERAERTSDQAEMLLDLASVPTEGADGERLRLALAYFRNPDLQTDPEAGPWIDNVDRKVLDLVGRLDENGVNSTIADCGNMILSVGLPPERVIRSLQEWGAAAQRRDMLDLSVASSIDDVIRKLHEVAGDTEDTADTADTAEIQDPGETGDAEDGQNTEVTPDAARTPWTPDLADSPHRPSEPVLPGKPQGVPTGLYSDDFNVRAQALADARGGWAFNGVLSSDDREFQAAVTACAEMYERGVHDDTEVVREQSVIYARRIISGFHRRGDTQECDRWCRKVIDETAHLSTPRCVRARFLALWDLAMTSDNEQERARALSDVGSALNNNYSDYAACYGAMLTRQRAAEMPPGPERVVEKVRALDQMVFAEPLDEWEETDWRGLILANAPEIINDARQVGDAAAMVHCASVFLDWLEEPVRGGNLHVLNYQVRRQLQVIPADPAQTGARVVERRDALVARATAVLDAAEPLPRAFAGAADRFAGEADRWRADHSHNLSAARTAVTEATRILPDLEGEQDTEFDSGGFLAEEVRNLMNDIMETDDATALVMATIIYLESGVYRYDDIGWSMVGGLVNAGADPAAFITCRDRDLVLELYSLLEPLVDEGRDGASIPGFRRMSKAASRRAKGMFRRR